MRPPPVLQSRVECRVRQFHLAHNGEMKLRNDSEYQAPVEGGEPKPSRSLRIRILT